jgi:eukaryotic-like serine/threonine-protein kinase
MTDGISADQKTRQLQQHIEQARLVDQICRQFENAWNAGKQPRVEECLVDLDETIRHEVLTELLAVELELRRASGETPRLDEYLRRFPESADTISALLDEPLSTDAAPPDDGRIPERFGEFRIVREIGRGGMGVVYEAVQESLQRTVALKSLLHRIESHGDGHRRFEREARAIARLHHSHIVDVFGNGEHDGVPFFAMRFIDGEGLDKIITDCREPSEAPREFSTVPGRSKPGTSKAGAVSTTEQPVANRSTSGTAGINDAEIDNADIASRKFRLPLKLADRERTAAMIGCQIASALHYAHESGIVHRDIKPSNILIDADGNPWMTDFGLARLSETEIEASLTIEGSILGTLRYLPPESLQQTTDERGDQYSLGLTLYEMLALRPAFDRTDKAGLLHDLEHAARPALDDLQPDVSRDLVTIIHKAIDREPSARYASVGELGDDLQQFLNDEPIRARRISKLEQLSRWSRRNRGLAASLATVAVLLLVVAVGSAMAAGYFSSLNTKLSSTVEELTTTTTELTTKTNDLTLRTTELTVARNNAETVAAENLKLAQAAEAARDQAEDTVYFSRIALADRAWQSNDVQAATDLLKKCQPQPGAIDRRGWESRYLDGLCNSNVVHIARSRTHSSNYLYGIAFSPDGRWLATGSSSPWQAGAKSDVVVWHTRDFGLVGSRLVDINAPRRLRFSSDSRAIALLGESGTVLLALDRETGDTIPLDQIQPDTFAAAEPIVAEFARGGQWNRSGSTARPADGRRRQNAATAGRHTGSQRHLRRAAGSHRRG